MKRRIIFLITLFSVCFFSTVTADWLQDMSDQARRDMQRTPERVNNQPGYGSGCQPPGSPGCSQGPWGPNNRSTSGPMATVKWFVLCNTKGIRERTQNVGNIELGSPPTNNNDYKTMTGSFQNEPMARNWVNSNCPTWRCDWNANCVAAGTAEREQATQNCPPGMVFVDAVFGQGYCKYP